MATTTTAQMTDLRLMESAEDMLDEEFGDINSREYEATWELRHAAIDKANELARRHGWSCINGTTMRHAIDYVFMAAQDIADDHAAMGRR